MRPSRVAHDVGEELVVLADRREPLGDALFLAPDDVDDGQRQDALRGLLQRRVEDLVHLVPQDHRRHGGGSDP